MRGARVIRLHILARVFILIHLAAIGAEVGMAHVVRSKTFCFFLAQAAVYGLFAVRLAKSAANWPLPDQLRQGTTQDGGVGPAGNTQDGGGGQRATPRMAGWGVQGLGSAPTALAGATCSVTAAVSPFGVFQPALAGTGAHNRAALWYT